jgi:CheY-like chemotaxis protein
LARKILLADDSVTAQNMGRKILADAGYEVIAVNNGSAALKKIAELKPDLAILDVYMPGYSGLEVCQRLKESPETARIPVLLTVGKLEPFKPEEAQRVRAEGYIVKPFEASELLSALSKLEDKVVPRAEPSKPGRFARAIAAAEETARGSRGEATKENGWKSRIGFPHKKTEPEEKVADESSIYNQVNRDLRTVVETAAEETAERKRQLLAEQAETRVDVPAPEPSQLPGDVTPEEVAAIAAAVAKMQMSAMAIQDDRVAETSSHQSVEPALDRDRHLPGDAPAPLNTQVETAASEESKLSQLDAAEVDHRRNGDEKADEREHEKEKEEIHDIPITMAATAESVASANVESRWTAVAVALDGEEAGVSLEQEMQKAYAAAEPYLAAVAAMPEEQTASAPNSPGPAESAVDAKVGAISNPEPVPSEPATVAHHTELEPAPVAQSLGVQSLAAQSNTPGLTSTLPASEFHEQAASPSSQQAETGVVAHVPSDSVPSEARPEEAIRSEVAGASQAQVESQNPVHSSLAPAKPVSEETAFANPEVANPAQAEVAGAYSDGARELPPGPIAEAAQVMVSNSASTPIVKDEKPTEQVPEQAPEPKPETETVKSTAAAWASWRQIRDTSKSADVVQDHSMESDVPQHAPTESAMAVAAGAEQILQAAESSEPNRNPADVASIVDSVLADLRPKLMEEISRKMSQKK